MFPVAVPYEEDFRQMLHFLASPPYLKTVWTELERVRKEMEKFVQANSTENDRIIEDLEDSGVSTEGGNETLFDRIINQTNRLTQTVPGMKILLEKLDYKLGKFLLLVHFVLCCIHRQSDLGKMDVEGIEELPFSKNRHEKAQPDGAASKALARIRAIRRLANIPQLDELTLEGEKRKKIPDYDPRSNAALLIQLKQQEDSLKKIKENLDEYLGGGLFGGRVKDKNLKRIINELKLVLNDEV